MLTQTQAKAAGADLVGMEELAAEVKGGNMDFDVVIADPCCDARCRSIRSNSWSSWPNA